MEENASSKMIFVDSSAFVGLYDETDMLAARARNVSLQLKKVNHKLVTGTNVLLEVATVLSQRVGHNKAITFLDQAREGVIKIIHPTETVLFDAEELFREQTSKNVSYSDCVSFAIMEELHIEYAFSFDKDFKKNGFQLLEEVFKN